MNAVNAVCRDLLPKIEETTGGWMVFEITAAGFGSGDMFLHWGVGKQTLGSP